MQSNRYFIEFSYKGTHYHGWQVQENAHTVQEQLEKALSLILRHPIETLGAGRTDTGVHAKQMFAQFDTAADFDKDQLHYQLNSLLPNDIAVKNVISVHPEAHARFDAISRSYEYHICREKNPFLQEFAWFVFQDLNIKLMNDAAKILFDYIDFSSFSKSRTQTFTNNCAITEAIWKEDGEKLVFHITANRFLRNMVRAIVGTLIEIGSGKLTNEDFKKIIESKNRSNAGVSVPAHGLYLTKIIYPERIFSSSFNQKINN
jgi:tRNA pseudouridine38-40 synthase